YASISAASAKRMVSSRISCSAGVTMAGGGAGGAAFTSCCTVWTGDDAVWAFGGGTATSGGTSAGLTVFTSVFTSIGAGGGVRCAGISRLAAVSRGLVVAGFSLGDDEGSACAGAPGAGELAT